ncbi:MAG: hypothetical protein U0807_01235 [Candidatus Binatia bacterium]
MPNTRRSGFAWLAVQMDRTRRLVLDMGALVRGVARTVRWVLRPPPPGPGLAVLEGSELARDGAPTAYRVRLHNPTAAAARGRLVLRGRRDGGVPGAFEVAREIALEPGATRELWLRTTWAGEAALLDVEPPDVTTVWTVSRHVGAWAVEAVLSGADGRPLDALRIAGGLVE